MATGNCTLLTNAMVSQVMMDADHKRAIGIRYVDRITRQTYELRARAVVLCAQALESARMLLNSKTRQQPNGLANSSGALGRYLMDHLWVAGGAEGEFPDFPDRATFDRATRPNGVYVIRFRNTINGPRSKEFVRGYGFQGGNRAGFNLAAAGFGADWKKAMLDPVVSVALNGFGECLPYRDNHVEIDPDTVDVYGIPVLRITMAWGENEKKMIPDMAVPRPRCSTPRGPGTSVRSACRIASPVTASTNWASRAWATIRRRQCSINSSARTTSATCSSWTACGFASSACQNPTLTIMALAVRSTDRLLEEMKRGNL